MMARRWPGSSSGGAIDDAVPFRTGDGRVAVSRVAVIAWGIGAVLLVGCGRLGFDATPTGTARTTPSRATVVAVRARTARA